MRAITVSTGIIATVLSVVALAPKAAADDYDKKTTVTFDQPVEVPGGVVLQPGKYVFILQDSQNDRHEVLIKNDRENKLYAQVFATSAYHVKARGKSQFLFWETPAGQPQILRTWFYAGDVNGNTFLYSKQRAAEIRRAQKSGEDVPSDDNVGGGPSSGGSAQR